MTLKKAYNKGVEILVYKTENTLENIELTGKSLGFNLEKQAYKFKNFTRIMFP